MANNMSNSPELSRAHSSLSPLRIWTLAAGTVTQLVRMRILWVLVVLCLLTVGLAFAFPVIGPELQLKNLKSWSFSAIEIFFVLFSVAATSLLLPRDVEDRTLYTILCKPVPRYEYLMGKLLGMMVIIFVGMAVMDVVVCIVVGLKQMMLFAEMKATLEAKNQATPDQLAASWQILSGYGLTSTIHAAIWSAFLEASVVAALTLLISCVASSTLFTILTSAAFVVGGMGEPLARDYFLVGRFGHGLESVLSFLLAMVCPDLEVFDLISPAVRGDGIPWSIIFQATGMASLYLAGYTTVAYLIFAEKEL